MGRVQVIFVFLRAVLRKQAKLAAENLALRQELAVLEQCSKRPRLRKRDRIFWAWLPRLWSMGGPLNEQHLRRILSSYFTYYHEARAHLLLCRNSPIPREIEPPDRGKVIAIPQVGGLHHCQRHVRTPTLQSTCPFPPGWHLQERHGPGS